MFSFNLHCPRVEESEHGWKSNSIQSQNAIPHLKKSHINVSLSQFQDKIPTYLSTIYLKNFNVMIQRLIGVMGGHILFIVGLASVGKDIVFRFIIEYNRLRDFGP
jgi:hypothetical protein